MPCSSGLPDRLSVGRELRGHFEPISITAAPLSSLSDWETSRLKRPSLESCPWPKQEQVSASSPSSSPICPRSTAGFSQREVNISLLDARAGSPPTAGELLRRHGAERIQNDGLADYLRNWETWSGQLMETHLSYPFLCFFRSQHDNQSWVAAFAAILDTCALLIAYGEGETKWQAQLTFAIARHAVSDLAQIFSLESRAPAVDRLPAHDLAKMRQLLLDSGVRCGGESSDEKLKELRLLYEPHLNVLSKMLLMPLPTWGLETRPGQENTVWGRITSRAPGKPEQVETDHF